MMSVVLAINSEGLGLRLYHCQLAALTPRSHSRVHSCSVAVCGMAELIHVSLISVREWDGAAVMSNTPHSIWELTETDDVEMIHLVDEGNKVLGE